MGGQQAYQWAAQYPNMVENIVAMCAHAQTSGHTHVFLEGMYAALTSDLNWNNGNYEGTTKCRERPQWQWLGLVGL
jgi:homoserine O-acetyltransferase